MSHCCRPLFEAVCKQDLPLSQFLTVLYIAWFVQQCYGVDEPLNVQVMEDSE